LHELDYVERFMQDYAEAMMRVETEGDDAFADSENRTNDGHTPPSGIASDIDRCLVLISLAATSGIRLLPADVKVVQQTRAKLSQGNLSPEEEGAFYSAMSQIVRRVSYPSTQVDQDIKLCSEVVSHAARTGKSISKDDVAALSKARVAQRHFEWAPDIESAFYSAMGRISKSVSPVVAETAGFEARKGARIAIRKYTIAAGILTACVLLLSSLLFIIKQISEDISKVVERNDPIAVSMHNQLQAYAAAIEIANKDATPESLAQMQNSPDAVAIKEGLQKFATNNRQLYADVTRTRAITHFIFRIPNWAGHLLLRKRWGEDWGGVDNRYGNNCVVTEAPMPQVDVTFTGIHYGFWILNSPPATDWQCTAASIRHALEIDVPIFALGETADKKKMIPQDAVNHGFQKIAVYQDIRAMATYARDIILVSVGSITGFLLPVLYAWLGACAAILRQLKTDTAACLFHPEYSKVANRAHVTTAVIVGISIGLFSNLLQAGTEISPLAIAFVAGYASDKFFEFVDRLVHAIFPSPAPSNVTPPPRSAGGDTPRSSHVRPSRRPLFVPISARVKRLGEV
jgi:hypothetical protein